MGFVEKSGLGLVGYFFGIIFVEKIIFVDFVEKSGLEVVDYFWIELG